MAEKGLHEFTVIGIPNLNKSTFYFCCFIKGSSGHSVAERVVERERVDHILMAFQSKHFLSGVRVPYLACPVIAPRNKSK